MKKNWFKKLLISYLPIFFVIILILFVLFFMVLIEWSNREMKQASQISSEQTIQTMDHALQTIDQFVIKELLTNELLISFFKPNSLDNSPWLEFKTVQQLNSFMALVPWIDSVYVYRYQDDIVLTNNNKLELEQFGDKAFVERLSSGEYLLGWTGYRTYTKFPNAEEAKPVVSLVRKAPQDIGEVGYIVINVGVHTLQSIIDNNMKFELSRVRLTDRDQTLLATSERMETGERTGAAVVLDNYYESRSGYTGWSSFSERKHTAIYNLMSSLAYIWFITGIIVVISGIIWIVYISRQNYRPIEAVVYRISKLLSHHRNFSSGSKVDEFDFIEKALDNLIETSNAYKKDNEEGLLYRRRHMFLETMEGSHLIEDKSWREELVRYGYTDDFESFSVAVIEIDKLSDFSENYTPRDQALLKIVLQSAIQETAENYSIVVWTEWSDYHKLCVLVLGRSDFSMNKNIEMFDSLRMWVQRNLSYTVTIGIGYMVAYATDIQQSYREAVSALEYKSVLGLNRIICHWELDEKKTNEMHNHMVTVRQMAQIFRLGQAQWTELFGQLIDDLHESIAPREEIISLFGYINYNFQREMYQLPEEVQEFWQQETRPELNEAFTKLDVLHDIQELYLISLKRLESKIQEVRESKNGHLFVLEIKQYVLEHLHDADLSLSVLSERFELHPNYLSKLFKDDVGEKFLEYLVRIRMDKAKELLAQTSEPIQSIAVQVGYLHAISFNRVFKKMTGLTPSEFKKNVIE